MPPPANAGISAMNKIDLDDIPVFDRSRRTVPASYFNRAKLALLRLGKPLRLNIEGLRNLDLILDDDLWVCVDSSMNDLPVIAWLDFETVHRSALHEPIGCEIRYYHSHAGMIRDRILEAMDKQLAERLHPAEEPN